MTSTGALRHCRILFGFLVLIFTFVSAFGQSSPSVSGCVQDSTNAAISGSTVILTGSDSNRRFQARTDDHGCFTIEGIPPAPYHLSILAEAFAPFEKDIDVRSNTTLDAVKLEIEPIQNSIVVSATRTATPAMTLGSSVDVIDENRIAAAEARNTTDVLRTEAGIAVVRTGDVGGLTSLFTRGGESDYTKILIDGIPLNQPGGAYDFSHLATDNISRIEVVRGPQSALFGSDAITGVVQIFTKPGTGTPEVEYSAEGGTFATTDQRVAFRGGLKAFDFSNTFSRFDTDNTGKNNDYRSASYYGNFGYSPNSRQSLRATLLYDNVKAGTPGVNAPGFTSFGPDDRMSRLERGGGLTYHVLIGSRLTQHVAYRLYDYDQYFYSSFGISTALHTRHRFEYHGDFAVPKAGTLSYGIDYDRENATVASARRFRNNVGYYVQQQAEFADRLNITAGVRVEDNTTFGTSATPRVAVSFRLWDPGELPDWLGTTRARFNAGTGIKEPSFIENFSDNRFFMGNPNLLAEKSRSWEAGIEQGFAKDRIVADIDWFDNRFRNLIQLAEASDGSGEYFNVGRSLARGIEFRLRSRFRQLSVQSNYSFLDGHIQDSDQTSFPFRPGDPLLRRPRHSSDVSLTWTGRRWNAFWTTRYVGKRADSDFFTFSTPLFENDSYSSSNAAFTYNFGIHASAYLRLENIFDRSYQEALGYQALGRSAVVGFTVRTGVAK